MRVLPLFIAFFVPFNITSYFKPNVKLTVGVKVHILLLNQEAWSISIPKRMISLRMSKYLQYKFYTNYLVFRSILIRFLLKLICYF